MRMRILAYAKLNLALDITGQRGDGYHTLDMVMQEIDLCDELDVTAAQQGIVVVCNVPLPSRNTAYLAAECFFDYTHCRGGVKITLKKHIPDQAGLGGGSSDAAAVLRALNSLYAADLKEDELRALALRVGSDVPFFITGGCARVRGVGEIVEPIQSRTPLELVLAKPKPGVSTAQAYRMYHDCPPVRPDVAGVVHALQSGDVNKLSACAGNALAPAARILCPEIIQTGELLCDARFTQMTGSGSCVFGCYDTESSAREAYERIKKRAYFSCLTHSR